jgi:transposase
MARGASLSNLERGKIIAYYDAGMSKRSIATKINRSTSVIRNFLRSPENYSERKTRGIRRKVSDTAKRRLLRAASNQITSASKLQRSLGLKVSLRRVQQILQKAPNLEYRKMKRVPWMNSRNILQRIDWATKHIAWNSEWESVIFSDEKKFNLDGPDGLMCYWHDSRKSHLSVGRRVSGGGSVMIWGAFHSCGKSQLAILDGKQTSESYVKTLNNFLLPMIEENHQKSLIFQHDNAAIHTAHLTKLWLLLKNIKTMEWPAHSPDLNPIENVWGLLARRVYAEGRVFQSVKELKAVILHEWQTIEIEVMQNLLKGMQDRCLSVLNNKGQCIS